MRYLIDGYNFLFRLTKDYATLTHQKKSILTYLHSQMIDLHLDLVVVFDGREKDPPHALRKHLHSLELIYTPSTQTADQYILEVIEHTSHPEYYTVVSSDREVTGKAKHYGARTLTIEAFLSFLSKKKKKREKHSSPPREIQETPYHIQRLTKIFEDLLQERQDD